jgi:hypothetical protein
MSKFVLISFLAILGTSGCSTQRLGWQWVNRAHARPVAASDDEADCEEAPESEEETATHHGFWRKLLPWDQEEDTRPYDQRLEEFNEKFRNNG